MSQIKINKASKSVVIGGSVKHSNISIKSDKKLEIFEEIQRAVISIEDDEERESIASIVREMERTVGSPSFTKHYKEFVAIASDHVTVLTPFIAGLAQILS